MLSAWSSLLSLLLLTGSGSLCLLGVKRFNSGLALGAVSLVALSGIAAFSPFLLVIVHSAKHSIVYGHHLGMMMLWLLVAYPLAWPPLRYLLEDQQY